jgi:hypothetical protein
MSYQFVGEDCQYYIYFQQKYQKLCLKIIGKFDATN